MDTSETATNGTNRTETRGYIAASRAHASLYTGPHHQTNTLELRERSPSSDRRQPPIRRPWRLDYVSWTGTGCRLSHPQAVRILLGTKTVCAEVGRGLDPYTPAMEN